jgi:hypothetical protein
LWSCSEHIGQVFSNAQDLEDHYRTVHASSDQGLLNTKAPPLLDVSKDSDSTCPMCSTSIEPLTALQSHVALHLERLAAFSFPRSVPADEDGGSDAQSNDANFGQGSRGDDFEMSSFSGSIPEPAQLQDGGSEDEASLLVDLMSLELPEAVGAKRVDPLSTRDAIFEPYKTLIEHLYVENRMPLKDVMEHMRVQYGFNQTQVPSGCPAPTF